MDFGTKAVNLCTLDLPAAWSCSIDGVTLANGDKILPMSVKYTNSDGHLVTVPVAAPCNGTSYSGDATAGVMGQAVEEALLPVRSRSDPRKHLALDP